MSSIADVYNSLEMPTKDANAGQLNGTRLYYSNDYMVRSSNYLIMVYTDVYFRSDEARVMSRPSKCILIVHTTQSVPIPRM